MAARPQLPVWVRFAVLALLVGGPVVLYRLQWSTPDDQKQAAKLGTPSTPKEKPFSELYRPHPERWTALRPGARIEAPVGLGSRYEQLWSESGLSHAVRIGGDGLRHSGASWWRTPTATPAPGGLRILLMGDSFAFGFYVDDDATFASLLSRRDPSSRVNVLNAGVPGYSSAQGFLYLRELLPRYRPHIVLLAFGTNDARDAATRSPSGYERLTDGDLLDALRAAIERPGGRDAWTADPWAVVRSLPTGGLDRLRRSWIYRQLRDPLVALKRQWTEEPAREDLPRPPGAAPGAVRRVPAEEYEAILHAMIDRCRAADAEPIFIAPTLEPDYRAAMRRAADTESIPLLDVPALFRRHRETQPAGATERSHPWLDTSVDGVHPNPLGHKMIADALSDLLDGGDDPSLRVPENCQARVRVRSILEVDVENDAPARCARRIGAIDALLTQSPPARVNTSLDSLMTQLAEPCREHSATRMLLAAAQISLGRNEDAMTQLQPAIDALPWPGEPHLVLAAELQRAGRGDEALPLIRALVRHAPGTPLAASATQLLPNDVDPDGRFEHEAGHAWLFDLHPEFPRAAGDRERSRLVLLEDGVPLSTPKSLHDDIRTLGLGRYSHWGPVVYFATSDNSDPNLNGRVYRVDVRDPAGAR